MAQYIIPVTFADDTGFVAWLSPTITIRQRDDRELVYSDIVSETMEDKWLGDYVYIFYDYDKSKLYNRKIDGGSDELTSRFSFGNNELDYYSNKEDYGIQVRGAIGWYANHITKRFEKLEEILELLKPEKVDLSDILEYLEKIDKKEITINNDEIISKIYELEDKFDSKKDKMDIISAMKNNEANLIKLNDDNREIINKLLEQQKEDREIIQDLKKYIEKLIRRWDIEKDSDFRKLVKEIKESENNIKELSIYMDQDFISLTSSLWVLDD